ncbi:hypothetical protein J9303_19675 [Bacillaceae bacterium Marseille-Q3522]|nr:hypothetical protein [Bacillaceae bacterium Marseille-Q3522]
MRIVSLLSVITILLSTLIAGVSYAETRQDALQNKMNSLRENQEEVHKKEQEKQAAAVEIKEMQKELQTLQNDILTVTEQLEKVKTDISDTKAIIEEKKLAIIQLEDQVLNREEVLKKRLVTMQKNNPAHFILETLAGAESLSDLFNRINAVTTLMDADQDLLINQRDDLEKIEAEKEEIAKKEAELVKKQEELASMQTKIQENLNKRQEALAVVQEKYAGLEQELAVAEAEKAQIQQSIKQIQTDIQKEQKAEQLSSVGQTSAPVKEVSSVQQPKGKELYVTATAYSHEDTKSDYTSLGYNIRTNPNLKLIAVDPRVIPLGSKVWVEGYGIAVAGDTGGSIKGHKIDVLMPNSQAALQWGRRTVKIIILN